AAAGATATVHSDENDCQTHPPQQQPTPLSAPFHPDSKLRFNCTLEAPTAATQRLNEPTLTYLNKGQLYGMILHDRELRDTDITTTIRIAFHEDQHRKSAATYWNFWLNQQPSPRSARAIELDKAGSVGIKSAESKSFDRITLQWNGMRGAKIMLRFHCLSTDFSRIKGVKGIPLRIHVDTREGGSSTLEACFTRIKLFRDKGAERKNKDDQRHIEKQLEKLRAKSQSHGGSAEAATLSVYAPISLVTYFVEYTFSDNSSDNDDEPLNIDDIFEASDNPMSSTLSPLRSPSLKRSSVSDSGGIDSDSQERVGIDPTYIPVPRKRRAIICLFIRYPNEKVYRAMYLEQLTLTDFVKKLAERLELQITPESNVEVVRKTKRGLTVKVDDSVIAQLEEEQDMEVDCTFSQESGALIISLHY
ncbi:hypothetical protein EV182_001101, partial [Spiromyces aspiralis]